jgi:isocitrate dehydrogenase
VTIFLSLRFACALLPGRNAARDPRCQGAWKSKLLIKDAIADIALQQVLTRPEGALVT